jgi:hypothetical protein
LRRLDFSASAAGFAAELRKQPDPGEGLRAGVIASFAALDSGPDDEREWRVRAELAYPEDRILIDIRPTGKTVRAPRGSASLIPSDGGF